MLASDVRKFLSPNHFGTLIVKNQEHIGAFPQRQKVREFEFHEMYQ